MNNLKKSEEVEILNKKAIKGNAIIAVVIAST